MRCRCKVLSVNGIPASDGSIVPLEVMNSYINSKECKAALESHKMIGSLTHRSRNLQSTFTGDTAAALSKTVGKDDAMIIVSDKAPTPTHYIEDLFIESGWLWADIKVLEEEGLDDIAIQNIRRLKGMLKNGILPGVSAVILGYWDSKSTGTDVLQKCVGVKGIDITLNPSWKDATVTEILDHDSPSTPSYYDYERQYSEKSFSEAGGIKVKTFSDLSMIAPGVPRSSKINGVFTKLQAKVFSSVSGTVQELDSYDYHQGTKTFSAATVNERVRFAKLSPRERFRRLIMDYRQSLKSQGGIQKISEETLRVMKSLFAGDVLEIMKTVTPLVLEGKNLMTLLNAGSLGVQVRKACQNMYLPYKQALMEVKKQGFVSKNRYAKITEAYTEFISALQDYVFGTPVSADEELNTEEEELN